MQCNEIKTVLNAYLDKELSLVQKEQVMQHLKSCDSCSEDYAALSQVKDAVKFGNLYVSAPGHLKKCVSEKLAQSEGASLFLSGLTNKLAYSIPGLLFGVLLSWATMSYLDTRQDRDALLQSLTSAHIRSLMASHLTDIASSDTHTVKPWFHGQLDFSPPVIDLTSQGYPLIGGRLEYLSNGSAAALVYRHRQHTVNLFIQPKSAQTVRIQSTPYKGYNIIYWDDDVLSYWAVSDLNLSDLGDFQKLLTDTISLQP